MIENLDFIQPQNLAKISFEFDKFAKLLFYFERLECEKPDYLVSPFCKNIQDIQF